MGCNWAFKSPSYFLPVPEYKTAVAYRGDRVDMEVYFLHIVTLLITQR